MALKQSYEATMGFVKRALTGNRGPDKKPATAATTSRKASRPQATKRSRPSG